MKHRNSLVLALLTVLTTACLATAAWGQTKENNLANVLSGGSSVRFEIVAQNAGATLTITAPDGRSFTKEFKSGAAPEFTFTEKLGLPDGTYGYELRLQPALTAAQQEEMKRARGKDDDPEADRAGRRRPVLPNLIQSGSFAVMNGQVVVGGLTEGERTGKAIAPPVLTTARVTSGNTATRLRNHRISLLAGLPDQVIPDDLIVQGSACIGLDCVNNESFGFDTIRLKENNTRIKFDDTSVSAGFPANDWQLTANDSASGGASKFSIEDITGSKVPFTIRAGASTNSIFVDSTGRLGLRTSTPVLDIHAATSNTPALRLEQNNSGGFTAQTWDIGANEANFFVRDVTGGSRLSFRIRPGAPTSSIDISADGKVGIGTASPTSPNSFGNTLVVQGTGSASTVVNNGTNNFEVGIDSGSRFRIIGNQAGNLITGDINGNVGIGTTAPDQKLSVNGDANKIGGGSWLNFSDERLKTIKGKYRSGLKAIMQLDPIRYEYLKNNALGLKSDGEHIGFGAQSLQKVIPEAVVKNSEGYLMVNNDPVIWTMLNAIKEQQKEIEQLKGQIRKLQGTSHRRRK